MKEAKKVKERGFEGNEREDGKGKESTGERRKEKREKKDTLASLSFVKSLTALPKNPRTASV